MSEVEERALRVLLVEDDAPLAKALAINLREEGWEVRWAATGQEALRACQNQIPDVVVLDWMLPDRPGIEICAELRRVLHPTPGVLMLTARGTEADIVVGLDHGADDYVVKPCRPKELAARVRAIARRVRGPEPARAARESEVLVRERLRVDTLRRQAFVDGVELKLTPTEHELLAVMIKNEDRPCSRVELLERVFDTQHLAYARNVDCHVARLRRKLEDAGLNPAPIRTLYGKGYVFSVAAGAP